MEKKQATNTGKIKKRQPTTYLNGLLGAVGGAIVGLILWVAVAYFVGGNLHIAFGFVLVLCVFYGYFLAGGKNGRGFYPMFLTVSLLFALVAFFTAVTVNYIGNMGLVGTDSFTSYARASYGGNEIQAYLDIFVTCLGIVFETFANYLKDFFAMLVFLCAGIVHYCVNKNRVLGEPGNIDTVPEKDSVQETVASDTEEPGADE